MFGGIYASTLFEVIYMKPSCILLLFRFLYVCCFFLRKPFVIIMVLSILVLMGVRVVEARSCRSLFKDSFAKKVKQTVRSYRDEPEKFFLLKESEAFQETEIYKKFFGWFKPVPSKKMWFSSRRYYGMWEGLTRMIHGPWVVGHRMAPISAWGYLTLKYPVRKMTKMILRKELEFNRLGMHIIYTIKFYYFLGLVFEPILDHFFPIQEKQESEDGDALSIDDFQISPQLAEGSRPSKDFRYEIIRQALRARLGPFVGREDVGSFTDSELIVHLQEKYPKEKKKLETLKQFYDYATQLLDVSYKKYFAILLNLPEDVVSSQNFLSGEPIDNFSLTEEKHMDSFNNIFKLSQLHDIRLAESGGKKWNDIRHLSELAKRYPQLFLDFHLYSSKLSNDESFSQKQEILKIIHKRHVLQEGFFQNTLGDSTIYGKLLKLYESWFMEMRSNAFFEELLVLLYGKQITKPKYLLALQEFIYWKSIFEIGDILGEKQFKYDTQSAQYVDEEFTLEDIKRTILEKIKSDVSFEP